MNSVMLYLTFAFGRCRERDFFARNPSLRALNAVSIGKVLLKFQKEINVSILRVKKSCVFKVSINWVK
jgi:hypothetical protein